MAIQPIEHSKMIKLKKILFSFSNKKKKKFRFLFPSSFFFIVIDFVHHKMKRNSVSKDHDIIVHTNKKKEKSLKSTPDFFNSSISKELNNIEPEISNWAKEIQMKNLKKKKLKERENNKSKSGRKSDDEIKKKKFKKKIFKKKKSERSKISLVELKKNTLKSINNSMIIKFDRMIDNKNRPFPLIIQNSFGSSATILVKLSYTIRKVITEILKLNR